MFTSARHAFSIMEVLVAIGIMLILTGLLLPQVSRTRQTARQITSLSRIRDLGVMTTIYAQSHRDLPPVIFAPVYSRGPGDMQTVVVNGRSIRGAWFNNGNYFHAAFSPVLPAAALRDPANPRTTVERVDGVATARFSDYAIANCFYAAPTYWDRFTQRGPEQWAAQPLTSVHFPAQKGFMKQITVYDQPSSPTGYPACCYDDVRSAVLWADLAATTEIQARLRLGVPNFWHHGLPAPLPVWAHGAPIDSTEHGVAGTDR
ncbi:MAG: type II secretion system protein [Phycisphaerales bacterium]